MDFNINKHIITDQAMTANITSETVDIANLKGYAVHQIYTGTPTGSLTVEVSNDSTNFIAVDTNTLSGAPGQKMVNIDGAHYRYVRVKYTFSSSTGTLNVYLSGKA